MAIKYDCIGTNGEPIGGIVFDGKLALRYLHEGKGEIPNDFIAIFGTDRIVVRNKVLTKEIYHRNKLQEALKGKKGIFS